MLKGLKELRKITKEIHGEKKLSYDAEGRVTVPVSVNDDTGFIAPFSSDGEVVISSDVADFLEHSVKHIKPGCDLHFVISGDTVDEKEKREYPAAIKNYYRYEFIECTRELKKNAILSIIMTALSALVFILAIVLAEIGVRDVILNMIDVVAWVFMWEAVDLFVLERAALRISRLRSLAMIKAKYTFI